jgi:hypothetical protein
VVDFQRTPKRSIHFGVAEDAAFMLEGRQLLGVQDNLDFCNNLMF